MVILHITPVDTTRANGLRFSVPQLASAQNDISNNEVAIFSIYGKDRVDFEEINQYNVQYFFDYKRIKDLPEPFNKPDVIIFHGIYYFKYIKLFLDVQKMKVPYIIVPRVSLTKGAQNTKRIKKFVWNITFFNKYVNRASAIHFLTENEMLVSKETVPYKFVSGNGITIPESSNELLKDSNNINITFIGRYAITHKGLDKLVEALELLKKHRGKSNFHIRLFGSDFRNGRKVLIQKLKEKDLTNLCEINGPVYGQDKEKALKSTDLFIAPSRYEGHPQSVIEALAYGIPCIVTKGTNMLEIIEDNHSGWGTKLEGHAIARTIIEATSHKEELINRGNNARKLSEKEFAWDKIAKDTLNEYSNLIKK